ncbi:AraC family transcriptional regulator [Pseudorhodoferax aquiterrae]|uniref:AraC family transcriptional regulator n=1 Tax=Pseudorhodoferax aquiterrae TaxID=747304 RepID=A0ABQ3FW43_9BURK|nr:AraC family transcriptional regulator [Pseudorhodoferax aquiterrae]GHC71950.1 AraC family transcriptional regulator [Pseudorhodoferax aquiterrae]
MDALSRVLALVPVTGRVDVRCHFGGPWRIEQGAADAREIQYHVLLRGTAWLDDPAGEPLTLRPGDIVMFPGGEAHRLHDGSGRPPAASTITKRDHLVVMSTAADAASTDVLCGRFYVPGSSTQLLLRHLPKRLVVHSVQADMLAAPDQDAQASVAGSRLARLIELMREEALEQGPGSEAMLNHLSAALFGLALRLGSLVDTAPQGLLALACNRQLQPALTALFEQPEAAWSLPRLAELCSMSRATFIRHFDGAFGRSASDLLTEIRMTIAGRKLEATRLSVAEIGEAVGYQSDAAFQRAFKKHSGVTPARWRVQAREGSASR